MSLYYESVPEFYAAAVIAQAPRMLKLLMSLGMHDQLDAWRALSPELRKEVQDIVGACHTSSFSKGAGK